MRMQGRQRHHKKQKKRVRPLKRLLHLDDEVWSFQVTSRFVGYSNTLGVRIRSPEGETVWVDAAQFVLDWDDDPFESPDYCCEVCFRHPGWGFAPGFIKHYIEVVLKGGQSWDAHQQTREYRRVG